LTSQEARREALREVRGVLDDPELRGPRLIEAIAATGRRHGIEPFRAGLHCLVQIERSEGAARALLEAIEEHRASLAVRLGRDPGRSVAALDYLHDLEGAIRNPVFRAGPGQAEGPGTPAPKRPTLSIEEILALEVRRGERYGRPLAVALLSPDDPPGGGDAVLQSGAAALRGAMRDVDHAARVLPEGFLAVLPCTPVGEALVAAERLRSTIRSATGVPWSAGVAQCPGQAWDPAGLARGARQALREARPRVGTARLDRRSGAAPPSAGGPGPAAGIRSYGGGRRLIETCAAWRWRLIRSATRFEPGERLTMAIREESVRPREVLLPARVVRAEPAARPEEIGWRLGVHFRPEGDERFRIAEILAALPDPAGGGRA
jgi:hypothetical protein